MKKIQIPFDLSKIDKDTRIETKDGCEVEILKTDMRGEYPILGIVKKPDQSTDLIAYWTIKGSFDKYGADTTFDLVIVKECLSWWDTHSKDRVEQYWVNGYGEVENHYISLNDVRCPSTPELTLQQYAFVQISHILKNDFDYGGMITKDEWNNSFSVKFCIIRCKNEIQIKHYQLEYHFLAFHTEAQAERFIEEYPELVKQYLGIKNDITL